jgi:hypothetical protein
MRTPGKEILVRREIALAASLLAGPTGCQFEPRGSTAPDGADAGSPPVDEIGIPLVLTGPGHYLYDTTTGVLTADGGEPIENTSELSSGLRVLSASSVLLERDAALRVIGDYPLALEASTTIEIAGVLDASSSEAEGDGAGANREGCGDPSSLSGGCRGAGAGGGSGGGALALGTRARLAVSGRILVGGAGGAGGDIASVGGGGGAGGAIWLEAHQIILAETALLSANGGGGGEGGDGDDTGRAGEAARPDGRRAHGGAGLANDGGDGGEGAGDMELSGKPGKSGAGAAGASGGAGGDGGLIRLTGLVEDAGAHITPAIY